MKKLRGALLALPLAALLALPALAAPEETGMGPLEPDMAPPEPPIQWEEPVPEDQTQWVEPIPGDLPPEGDVIPEELLPQVPTVLADPNYSGPLDPRTGLPPEQGEPGTALAGAPFDYDRAAGCYTNPVGSRTFTSSVPNGAVVSDKEKVSFSVPSGLAAVLYRNGDAVENPDLANITQAGSYLLEVRGSGGESQPFSFQIVSAMTNSLTEISLPTGFTFDYVTLNGDGLTPEYANYLDLMEDGEYDLRWSCTEIGQSYDLTFILDTQPPTLALPGVAEGQAHGPVTLEDLEENCYILMDLDGEEKTVTSPTTVLKDAGKYVLTVYDQAGNSTRYEFVIHMYLNISAWAALGMILALVLGLFGYSRYIKKHPKVG